MTAIGAVNTYLGQVFNLVETDSQLIGKTAIVLSADHGGSGTNHSTAATPAHYTIPFYVWGPGVAHGDLYALNVGTRTDPGTGRPDYNASGQPIRNGDGGNLALSLLGLTSIPGSLINAEQDLRVVEMSGDFNLDNTVDAADYVTWRKDVDDSFRKWHYNLWSATFGQSGGPASSVPEPDLLATIAVCCLSLMRRKLLPTSRRTRPNRRRNPPWQNQPS
jgi:hypothetical protein